MQQAQAGCNVVVHKQAEQAEQVCAVMYQGQKLKGEGMYRAIHSSAWLQLNSSCQAHPIAPQVGFQLLVAACHCLSPSCLKQNMPAQGRAELLLVYVVCLAANFD